MDSDDEVVVASAAFIVMSSLAKKKKKRRYWMSQLYRDRALTRGPSFVRRLIEEEEDGHFRNFVRMSSVDFVFLLEATREKISRTDTTFRKAISPEERLALTLRFLATGDSYASLKYVFNISKQRISLIVPEVCRAIIETLIDQVKILGGFLFGLSVALRLDTGLQEWIDALDIWQFYLGIYVFIFVSILVQIVPFLSCFSVYQEIKQLLVSNVACHTLCFFLLMIGSAITLENSKTHSGIQQSIRESMQRMIINSYDNRVSLILNLIQEEVGCCGADGPNDYLALKKPLPNECRDTVTGNAYFHGCTDEITWFLEDKSSWLTGIAFTLGFLHMLIAALSYILILALQKEEKMAYRR